MSFKKIEKIIILASKFFWKTILIYNVRLEQYSHSAHGKKDGYPRIYLGQEIFLRFYMIIYKQ